MSVADLQKRLADLTFSAKEIVKGLEKEQNDSEDAHADWEDLDPEEDEPEVIDNSDRVNHLEKAIDLIDEAVAELDGALDE